MRRPPYAITPAITGPVEEIGEAIGRAETAGVMQDLRLRRVNRISTIRGSLAIEGNRLSQSQIATILDGGPVVGPVRDVQEARNAIEVYDRYQQWDPAANPICSAPTRSSCARCWTHPGATAPLP